MAAERPRQVAAFPPVTEPLLLPNGQVGNNWLRFFQALWIQYKNSAYPLPITDVVVSGSPFVYETAVAGHLWVRGGLVNSVVLTRAGVHLEPGLLVGYFPMSPTDIITIEYDAAPTVKFVPS